MPRPPTIFIYRQSPSTSGVVLAAALREAGVPAKKVRRPPRRLRGGDFLVGWGDAFPDLLLTPSLNWKHPTGKLTELRTLEAAGVATVRFATHAPLAQNTETWLGRAFAHHSGNDLLVPPRHPGFWVLKEDLRREWRIHVWGGVSARVALKVPKGDDAHPWLVDANCPVHGDTVVRA